MMIDKYDSEKIYCRKLGHHLTFGYCRVEKGNLPCSGILDCWYEKIKVETFLKEHYSAEDLDKVFSPPPSKTATIFDLIEKAKQRADE